MEALRGETPPQYQYLLKDLFENITLFSNRTLSATAHKRTDGKYDVTVDVETHKYTADAKGAETEVPVDDWIEVGALAAPGKGKALRQSARPSIGSYDRQRGKILLRDGLDAR